MFAVLGNHDWWNNGPKVRAAFEAHGVTVLDDEVRRIHYRGKSFCLLGVRDETQRLRSAQKELELALPGLPLLVLVHEPDPFADLDERATLTLAGHTHGGQVDLPLFGRRIVPSRFGSRYAAGHIVENGRHLFVNHRSRHQYLAGPLARAARDRLAHAALSARFAARRTFYAFGVVATSGLERARWSRSRPAFVVELQLGDSFAGSARVARPLGMCSNRKKSRRPIKPEHAARNLAQIQRSIRDLPERIDVAALSHQSGGKSHQKT